MPENNKATCPICSNKNTQKKGQKVRDGVLNQKLYCLDCKKVFYQPINSTRVSEATKCFDESLKETLSEHEKYMYSPKCFFCHAQSLNMAFPARIVAISHEEAAEKMSEDIVAKIADPEQVARIAKSLVIHVFDSNKNIVAIYKSSNVRVEFIQENILDVDLDDISE
jgi:transposase-like protein